MDVGFIPSLSNAELLSPLEMMDQVAAATINNDEQHSPHGLGHQRTEGNRRQCPQPGCGRYVTRSGKRYISAQKFEIALAVLGERPKRKEYDGANPASVAHSCDAL